MSEPSCYNGKEVKHLDILALGNARVNLCMSPDNDYHVTQMAPGGNLMVIPGETDILFIKALPDMRAEISIVVGDETPAPSDKPRECDIAIMIPEGGLSTIYLQAGDEAQVEVNMDLGALTLRTNQTAQATINTASGVLHVIGNDQSKVRLVSAHDGLLLKTTLQGDAKLDASTIHLKNPSITLTDSATMLCASRSNGRLEKSGKSVFEDMQADSEKKMGITL